MYRESYQRGFLTIFYSCGSKPLNIWDTYTKDGYITKFLDEDIKSTVLEIGGTNVSTTYMVCPKGKMTLGITMPFLVMVVKNLKKYFSFEVTILDDTGTRRRFRVSNFQSTTQILPLCTVMPIALSEGWNQIQFNMSDFCRRAYKKQYVEVQKFKINANIRIRRIYFADRILPEDQMPAEYKLFVPLKQKPGDKYKTKTDEKVEPPQLAPQQEKSAELKRDSISASVSKVTKVASVVKTVSQVQAFEKRSSKVVEGAEVEVTFESPPEAPVATAEGAPDQSDVVAEVPVVTAEPGAVAESGPDQGVSAIGIPVTEKSVTEDLVTEAPVTEDLVTEAPVTEELVTEAPVTEDLVTEAPVTEELVTEAPVTEDLVTEAPVTEASVTEALVIEASVTEAPVIDAPVTDAPVTEAPVTEAPITETPVTEEPVPEAPVTEEPVPEAPVTETPVATEEVPSTVEAATETTELVKEKSIEAAVQTEGVITMMDAPIEDVATDTKEDPATN